jgi:gliding motility-associated-like protein
MRKISTFLSLLLLFNCPGFSQTMQLLPNPDGGYGYVGMPIVYNNKLYAMYRDATHATRLAQYDGNTVKLIPNPDPGDPGFYGDSGIIYNNKLYFQYENKDNISHLGQFDGQTVTIIPNPDYGFGYTGLPRVYNNTLCIQYMDSARILQLAVFDGTSIKKIIYPGTTSSGGYTAWPIVYNGKLYVQYFYNGGVFLGQFDGASLTLIPNLPGGNYGTIGWSGPVSNQPFPVIYDNKLCFLYSNDGFKNIAEFDGSKITLIPNPDTSYSGSNASGGYANFPIIYNNKLYIVYSALNDQYVWAAFDGNKLSIVGGGPDNLFSNPVIYDCNLYFFGKGGITGYDGNTFTNVTQTGLAESIIYHNDLYFPSSSGLAQYDGTNINSIANPLSTEGVSGFNNPTVYNNKLVDFYFTSTGTAMAYLQTPGADSLNGLSPQFKIKSSAAAICAGQQVTFTAIDSNLNDSYQWQLNGNNIGTDDVVFKTNTLQNGDMVNCIFTHYGKCSVDTTSSNTISIEVDAPVTPLVKIIPSSTNICKGDSVLFTAQTINEGNSPTYQWQVNGNNIGDIDSSFTDKSINNGDMVNCILTSNAGCVTTATAISNKIPVIVNPLITPAISITTDTNNICYGTPVTFTAASTNGGNLPGYQWKINGIEASTGNYTYTNSNLQNGNDISCTLTSNLGCAVPANSNSILITVYPLPTIADEPEKIIQSGTNTTLDIPVNGKISTYLWTPPDGLDNAGIANPIATPTANTIYYLKVTTTDGCTATGKITIDVFSNLLMPNAFSPNEDGLNDVFRIPPSISVKITSFIIYDRWGNQVFSTSDTLKGWDGTYKGEQQPSGTYIWMIRYVDPLKNEVKKLNGTVILIR